MLRSERAELTPGVERAGDDMKPFMVKRNYPYEDPNEASATCRRVRAGLKPCYVAIPQWETQAKEDHRYPDRGQGET